MMNIETKNMIFSFILLFLVVLCGILLRYFHVPQLGEVSKIINHLIKT
ncbi:hypothetical protein B0G93_10683 [Bacillus sp. V-88]|nr:hypothetical protein B0G93_10683 [Bacillus sp. V-88]SLK21185.1 hypothetical protein SAMN06295884_10683 [Bacillus sp. V-88]